MAVFFDSLAKAAAYFGGVISPQRLGQLADAQQLHTQEVASGHGGPRRRGLFHEDIAVHLERGGKLDAHDCPCWRVAYAQALDNDVLPASDVAERVQALLDLERAEWARERQYLQAVLRTAPDRNPQKEETSIRPEQLTHRPKWLTPYTSSEP